MQIILTAADYQKNGFVSLAAWKHLSEDVARQFIAKVDAQISADMEPDDSSAYAFVLDLKDDDGQDLLDTSDKLLPTQLAMRLAPDAVQGWLDNRPKPNDAFFTKPVTADFAVFERL